MAESSEEWVYPYITWGGNPREVVEIRKGAPLAHIGKGAFIQHPEPLTADGKITEECRSALLGAACAFCKAHGGIATIAWGVHGFSHAGVDANGNSSVQSVLFKVDDPAETSR